MDQRHKIIYILIKFDGDYSDELKIEVLNNDLLIRYEI
jgi:hypothetical protein